MSDDLVKCLWKGVADVDQQQDAADLIEELEGKLVWAMEYVAGYAHASPRHPHLFEWANANLAQLLKGEK